MRKDVTEHTRSGHSTLVPFSLELNVIDRANYYISLRCFLCTFANKVVRTRTECNISSKRKSFRNISRTIQDYPIMQCKGKSSTIHTGSIWISKSTRLRLWRVVTSMHSFEVVNVPVYHVICYLPSHAAPHFSKTLFFQGMILSYLYMKKRSSCRYSARRDVPVCQYAHFMIHSRLHHSKPPYWNAFSYSCLLFLGC